MSCVAFHRNGDGRTIVRGVLAFLLFGIIACAEDPIDDVAASPERNSKERNGQVDPPPIPPVSPALWRTPLSSAADAQANECQLVQRSECCDDPVLGTDDADVVVLEQQGSTCGFAGAGGDIVVGSFADEVLAGGEGSDLLKGKAGDDLVLAGPGDDLVFAGEGDDDVIGGDGWDDLRGHWGADALDGGGGKDSLRGGPGDDRLLGGTHSDVLLGGSGHDRIDGSFGADWILGSAGDDLIVPGPGADYVHGGWGSDVVVLYGECELVPGKVLLGGWGYDTLISPVPLYELAHEGVFAWGFERVVVDPGLGSQSDCSCFHGDPVSIDASGVTCACDEGWEGDRCDRCDQLSLCTPPEKVDELTEVLLGDQTPEAEEGIAGLMSATLLANSAVSGDLVVLAKPIAIEETFGPPGLDPNRAEPTTRVTLGIFETLTGPELERVSFVLPGRLDPEADGYGAELPPLEQNRPRYFALRLRGGENFLLGPGSDWRYDEGDVLKLGAYDLSVDTLRAGLVQIGVGQ